MIARETILLAMRLSSTAAVLALMLSRGVTAADFSRYETILTRKPFGEVPLQPDPSATESTQPQQPPFVKELRMCAVIESDLGIRVGFVNIKSKPSKSYFLYVGESEDGIELVDADYEMEAALLRKGTEEHWVHMTRGSGDLNQAAGSQSARAPLGAQSQKRKERLSYAERLRQRREAMRTRMRTPPKLTGEDLEKHLKEYQLELIRKGMPPLPIPLTREMDDQLVKEGVLPPVGRL